jgi:hypothetical protein
MVLRFAEAGKSLVECITSGSRGDAKVAIFHLETGTGDMDARSDAGQTVLHLVSKTGSQHELEFLIKKYKEKANFDAADKDEKTPLYFAAKQGSIFQNSISAENFWDKFSILKFLTKCHPKHWI